MAIFSFFYFLDHDVSNTAEPIFTKSSKSAIDKLSLWFLNSVGVGGRFKKVTFSGSSWNRCSVAKSNMAAIRIYSSQRTTPSNFGPIIFLCQTLKTAGKTVNGLPVHSFQFPTPGHLLNKERLS